MHIHPLIRRFLNSNANTSRRPCHTRTNTPPPTLHLNTTNPLASPLDGDFTHRDGRSRSRSHSTSLSKEHNSGESLLRTLAAWSIHGMDMVWIWIQIWASALAWHWGRHINPNSIGHGHGGGQGMDTSSITLIWVYDSDAGRAPSFLGGAGTLMVSNTIYGLPFPILLVSMFLGYKLPRFTFTRNSTCTRTFFFFVRVSHWMSTYSFYFLGGFPGHITEYIIIRARSCVAPLVDEPGTEPGFGTRAVID